MKKFLLPIVLVTLALPVTSHAYIDPGTGSFVIQMLIAGVLAGLFYLKLYWRRLKGFVTDRWRSVFGGSTPDKGHGDEQQ